MNEQLDFVRVSVRHFGIFKTLPTTGHAVRNTPLTDLTKGFSTEMSLEVV